MMKIVATEESHKQQISQRKLFSARFRMRQSLLLASGLLVALFLTCGINFGMTLAAVSSGVPTQAGPAHRLEFKDGTAAQVAQSGLETVLGVLPYLPTFAAAAALTATPEFLVFGSGADPSGGPYHAAPTRRLKVGGGR